MKKYNLSLDKNKNMMPKIHIGEMIKKHIDSHLLLRTAVAQKMLTPSTAIYAYEKRADLNTSTLRRVCDALQHNFFMDIALLMPAGYTRDASIVSESESLIIQQQKEIERLQLENTLLKELIIAKR